MKVLPGVNPAHRIIHQVLENRDRNNPEKMQSFAYTSYSKMYFTLDLDSMYADAPADVSGTDSLFLISFRPLSGRNFDGLQGILHINSNGYAIQNVIAEASEKKGLFRIRIQQKYDFIETQQWFPVQLNTDIMLSSQNAKANGMPITLVGIGKTYLSDIRLNPLTRKDANTYLLIDSIGEEANLDQGTLEKGYYESGLLFNSLLRQWIFGYGLGVFYRYGPYALPKTIDNFAFKFTLRFNL